MPGAAGGGSCLVLLLTPSGRIDATQTCVLIHYHVHALHMAVAVRVTATTPDLTASITTKLKQEQSFTSYSH